MTYQELQADLRRGIFRHVYLLAGEEPYFLRLGKESLLNALFSDPADRESGLNVLDTEPPTNELITAIQSTPFLTDKNVILIERSTLFLPKRGSAKNTEDEEIDDSVAAEETEEKNDKDTEKLIKVLGKMPADSYIIFMCHKKIDKRRKIYKTVLKAGCVMESAPIRPYEIVKQNIIPAIAQKLTKKTDRDALEYLQNIVSIMPNVSPDFIEQELKKAQIYATGDTVTKADLMTTLSSLPEVSAFALSDAISERNVKKALILLTEQLKSGLNHMMLLAILVRHVRQLWQLKEMIRCRVPAGEWGNKIGINPFIAKKLGQAAAKYDTAVLTKAFLALGDADYKLKTGQGGIEYLEHIIIMLCKR